MYKHLTVEQRYQIEALRKQSISLTAIAATIGVHKSTISRELKCNSLEKLHPPACYKAVSAKKFTQKRAYKPLRYKTTNNANCYNFMKTIGFKNKRNEHA